MKKSNFMDTSDKNKAMFLFLGIITFLFILMVVALIFYVAYQKENVLYYSVEKFVFIAAFGGAALYFNYMINKIFIFLGLIKKYNESSFQRKTINFISIFFSGAILGIVLGASVMIFPNLLIGSLILGVMVLKLKSSEEKQKI